MCFTSTQNTLLFFNPYLHHKKYMFTTNSSNNFGRQETIPTFIPVDCPETKLSIHTYRPLRNQFCIWELTPWRPIGCIFDDLLDFSFFLQAPRRYHRPGTFRGYFRRFPHRTADFISQSVPCAYLYLFVQSVRSTANSNVV